MLLLGQLAYPVRILVRVVGDEILIQCLLCVSILQVVLQSLRDLLRSYFRCSAIHFFTLRWKGYCLQGCRRRLQDGLI